MNGQNGFFFGRSPVRKHGVLHLDLEQVMSRRRNEMTGQILTLIVSRHPDGKIRVNVVEPGHEGIDIGSMAEQSCRNNSAPGGIVPAIIAVRIRHAASGIPVPSEVGAILPERTAEP